MLIFALLSGLVNLSSQVVFQKVVSMIVGDLYTTFIAVTLTFILGSAIGSYFGSYFRKYLAWIELLSGFYNLLVFALLGGSFYGMQVPLTVVAFGLFLPALALGTHIPLYSYYFRKMRFSGIYGLYHAGGILGLLAVEWYFTNAGSARAAVLTIALIQLLLGIVIGLSLYFKKFRIEESNTQARVLPAHIFAFVRKGVPAFAASILSFYGVVWALKTQTLTTETFRLHATSISSAVFFWMAVAGALGGLAVRLPLWSLFALMAVQFLAIYGTFGQALLAITDLRNGEMINYFVMAFVLSIYLTFPVLSSSLIFIHCTSSLQKKWDVDIASGILNLFASIGNLFGFILASTMAAVFWESDYFIVAVALVILLLSYYAIQGGALRAGSLCAVILIILSGVLFTQNLRDDLFQNRVRDYNRSCEEIVKTEVHSHPLSTMALYTYQVKKPLGTDCVDMAPSRFYVIDGHVSHDIHRGDEILVGLMTAKYLSQASRRSLVIGVGSGQSAWGVAAVSERTDLVEISPVVIENLDLLKSQNGNLRHRADVSFILQDGFNYLKKCPPGAYDLILNTSTYPSSFNASKLYSAEFLAMAERCLSSEGVYHTYFDGSSVRTQKELEEFLAPVWKYFPYVDVMLEPYPQVFAYKTPRNLRVLNIVSLPRSEDRAFINSLHPDLVRSLCFPVFRGVKPRLEQIRMSTLDRSYVEKNTIRNYVSKEIFGILEEYKDLLIKNYPEVPYSCQ